MSSNEMGHCQPRQLSRVAVFEWNNNAQAERLRYRCISGNMSNVTVVQGPGAVKMELHPELPIDVKGAKLLLDFGRPSHGTERARLANG
jgi:hypothetical protein